MQHENAGKFSYCNDAALWPISSHAQAEKELPVHNINYGSTNEVAYWIKALIGDDQLLDVKRLCQAHDGRTI